MSETEWKYEVCYRLYFIKYNLFSSSESYINGEKE